MRFRYAVLLYEEDPVAGAVAERWRGLEAAGLHIDGAAVRSVSEGVAVVRRAGIHIHDRSLDAQLPAEFRNPPVPLVFPSIHRSESGRPALTVHPIGNPRADASFGGEPSRLVATAPRLMTDALRRLLALDRPPNYEVSFEATHHGPFLSLPSFFVEIGTGKGEAPPAALAAALGDMLLELTEDPDDVVAVGVGGGHYAPRFTDLARERKFAFGHMLSRHAADGLGPAVARSAWTMTPGASGVVYHRAEDERAFSRWGLGPTLRETDVPVRATRGAFSPAAGT